MQSKDDCENPHLEGLARVPDRWELIGMFVADAVKNTVSEVGIFDSGVGERAIAHRLALHMQEEFKTQKWLVDCEYNRKKNEPKSQLREALIKQVKLFAQKPPHAAKLKQKPEIVSLNVVKELKKSSLTERFIFPDVLVHFRGCDCFNALVVEMKVNSTTDEAIMLDWAKLSLFTSYLDDESPKYSFGLFLNFISKEQVDAWLFNRAENRIYKLNRTFELETEVGEIQTSSI